MKDCTKGDEASTECSKIRCVLVERTSPTQEKKTEKRKNRTASAMDMTLFLVVYRKPVAVAGKRKSRICRPKSL